MFGVFLYYQFYTGKNSNVSLYLLEAELFVKYKGLFNVSFVGKMNFVVKVVIYYTHEYSWQLLESKNYPFLESDLLPGNIIIFLLVLI